MPTYKRGGCCCGKVRFELVQKPLFVHCCHCTWCQRESGSSFALNALIEAESVRIVQGHQQLKSVVRPTNSRRRQEVIQCVDCAVTLWSYYAAARDKVWFIRVGTLDSPLQPDIHIYTDSKHKWLDLSRVGIPVVPQYYRRSQYWSYDSIARYNRAVGKHTQSSSSSTGAGATAALMPTHTQTHLKSRL
jgi:hypothetical protein